MRRYTPMGIYRLSMSRRNKKLAASYRGKPCYICGLSGEGDHLKHFAGDPARDRPENILVLCRPHHVEKHAIGLTQFVKKYRLELELKRRGFFYDENTKKWKYQFRKIGVNDLEKNQ